MFATFGTILAPFWDLSFEYAGPEADKLCKGTTPPPLSPLG